MIALGEKVVDQVTGFKGTVTARAEYLHGDPRCLVENLSKDGDVKTEWFDAARLTKDQSS